MQIRTANLFAEVQAMRMRSSILCTAGSLMLGLMAAADNPVTAQFHVPFDFTVTGLEMPAGDYQLTALGAGAVSLKHVSTGKRVMAASIGSFKTSGESRLLFQKAGEACWLESADLNGLEARWRPAARPNAVEVVSTDPPTRIVLHARR